MLPVDRLVVQFLIINVSHSSTPWFSVIACPIQSNFEDVKLHATLVLCSCFLLPELAEFEVFTLLQFARRALDHKLVLGHLFFILHFLELKLDFDRDGSPRYNNALNWLNYEQLGRRSLDLIS